MIASVNGTILTKKQDHVIVEVNGIGLYIEIPQSTFYDLPDLGQNVFLKTHRLVREDAIRLFGFLTESELGLFRILMEITRVGPKLALAILSGISPADLHRAAIMNDTRILCTIPGIGKKSAERILFEVSGKIDKIIAISDRTIPSSKVSEDARATELISMMINLGYRQRDAERALDEVLQETPGETPVEDIIRLALKKLSRR